MSLKTYNSNSRFLGENGDLNIIIFPHISIRTTPFEFIEKLIHNKLYINEYYKNSICMTMTDSRRMRYNLRPSLHDISSILDFYLPNYGVDYSLFQ